MSNDNLGKFQQLVSGDDQRWVEKAKWRKENKDWLKKSALVALTVLRKLRDVRMTQKEFAEQLGVSAQHISKILKGRENLTLETISKMEAVLGIELASVPQYVTTETTDMVVQVSKEMSFDRFMLSFKKQERQSFDYDTIKQTVVNDLNFEDLTAA